MKFTRKVVVVFTLFAVLFSACTSNSDRGPARDSSARPTARPVTLRVWRPEDGSSFLPRLVETFEGGNLTINVELIELPAADYAARLEAALAAGEGPDLALVSDPRWVQAGYFLPLDDLVDEYAVPVEDFNKGAVSRECVYDEQIFCFGTLTRAYVLLYNKALFDEAGVTYPPAAEPVDMQRYADMVRALAYQSDNMEERVWGGDAPPPYEWMDWRAHLSEDGREIDGFANDTATVAAYQRLADLREEGAAPTSAALASAGLEEMESLDLFLQGRLAAMIASTEVLPEIEASGIRWGAAPVPAEQAGEQVWTAARTDGYGVPAASSHPEEALRLAGYLGAQGAELRLSMGDIPLRMTLAGQWAAGEPAAGSPSAGDLTSGSSEGRQQVYAVLRLAREYPLAPGYDQVMDLAQEAWLRVTEEGISAKEALDEAAPLMQEQLDAAWQSFGG